MTDSTVPACAPGALRYVFPTENAHNFGDYVIDHATRQLLRTMLPEPSASCDLAEGSFPTGSYDCLIIPGVTHVTPGHRPGVRAVGRLPYPAFCLATSLAYGRPRNPLRRLDWALKRALGRHDLSIASLFARPIGARDSFTYEAFRSGGLETLFTGCPTLHLEPGDTGDDGYVLLSLGRGAIAEQMRGALELARRHEVVGIAHEWGQAGRFRAAGWELPLVVFEGDVEAYLRWFRRATVVVTGRLHGALPALAMGKRVCYYGTRDTRTVLLKDLGIPTHGYEDIPRGVELASTEMDRALVAEFRANWDRMMRVILERSGRA